MPVNRAVDAARNVKPWDVGVPVDWVPLSEGTTPPEGYDAFRGIRANTSGTVTVVTGTGEERVMNFLAGETRWGLIQEVVAAEATGLEGAL